MNHNCFEHNMSTKYFDSLEGHPLIVDETSSNGSIEKGSSDSNSIIYDLFHTLKSIGVYSLVRNGLFVFFISLEVYIKTCQFLTTP